MTSFNLMTTTFSIEWAQADESATPVARRGLQWSRAVSLCSALDTKWHITVLESAKRHLGKRAIDMHAVLQDKLKSEISCS